jgi:lipopolysaccharide assembly outer membrane protein LptD (OstA)
MLSAEVGGEYNQSMETDDDVIFQRLPMATAMLTKSFRPFGYNPYGLRVTGRTRIVAVNFVRDDGYDGWRQEVIPGLRVPFHYRNFFESNLDANWYYTKYNLQETQDPYDANVLLDDSNSRNLPIIDYRVGTVLERVFPVSSSGFLATVTGLGAKNQDNNLVRVKHTIEPTISYRYVPEEDQDDLPLFDSRDRIEEKSLFTYGLRSALYGRFLPRRGAGEEIAELTPYVEELPMLEPQEPVTFGDAGSEGLRLPGVAIARRLGEVREIATAQVFQSYDAALDSEEEKESGRDSLSDVFVAASVFPSQYFGLGADSNVDHRDNSLSSWSLQTAFFDDRNDALRGRYTFVDGGVDQMEGNAELVLTEAVKLAYYARYDNDEGEFIEQQGVIRFLSSCNCWHFDLGVNDQINPDRQRLTLRFTFTGLGDITQDISTNRRGQ